MIRANASPAQQQRQAMHNVNAFKVGLFGANLSGARTATTVPDRWSARWPDCLLSPHSPTPCISAGHAGGAG